MAGELVTESYYDVALVVSASAIRSELCFIAARKISRKAWLRDAASETTASNDITKIGVGTTV